VIFFLALPLVDFLFSHYMEVPLVLKDGLEGVVEIKLSFAILRSYGKSLQNMSPSLKWLKSDK